jgi:hypothetical protein
VLEAPPSSKECIATTRVLDNEKQRKHLIRIYSFRKTVNILQHTEGGPTYLLSH